MTVAAALMSSASSTWQTPDCVLDLVRQLGPIALDPCTALDNPVGARVWCVAPDAWNAERDDVHADMYLDGLNEEWPTLAKGGLVYCNPPFGRGVSAWLARCRAAAHFGCEVIALVPARVDTAWWNDFCAPPAADAVCFWRGRLTFRGAPGPAPFPSAIVYHGPRKHRFADVFSTAGAIWS